MSESMEEENRVNPGWLTRRAMKLLSLSSSCPLYRFEDFSGRWYQGWDEGKNYWRNLGFTNWVLDATLWIDGRKKS